MLRCASEVENEEAERIYIRVSLPGCARRRVDVRNVRGTCMEAELQDMRSWTVEGNEETRCRGRRDSKTNETRAERGEGCNAAGVDSNVGEVGAAGEVVVEEVRESRELQRSKVSILAARHPTFLRSVFS